MSFCYTFIAAWCLGYFYAYLTGAVGIEPAAAIADQTAASARFYGELTGSGGNGLWFGPLPIPTAAFWARRSD